MIRLPPRSTPLYSSAASDVYKRQISNNGGWTAEQSNRPRVGRHLGFTRYDLMFDQIGAFKRYVEDPGDIKEALEAAVASKKPAVINVITDPYAMAPGSASTSEATTYYLNT